jgi:hypothetical protein
LTNDSELNDFKSLFDLVPCVSILCYTNTQSNLTNFLDTLIAPVDGKLNLILNDLPLGKVRLLAKPSSAEYLIVKSSFLDNENSNNLMQILNKALRDAGHIIILEEKNKDISPIYNLLEEFDYGAISSIDIFAKYNLIMGKKLHMWGMD